jgi:hypothetical protein
MKYTLLDIHPASGYAYVLLRPTSRYKAYKMRATYNKTPEEIEFYTRKGIVFRVVPVSVAMNWKHLIGREYL